MKLISQIRKLNLTGFPKVTAEATIAYIKSLEKQIAKTNRLKAQGKLIELCAPVGTHYYMTCPYFQSYTDCSTCKHTCGEVTTTPIQRTFESVDEVLALQLKLDKVVFLTQTSANKVKKQNTYVPRSELDEERLAQIRQSDKDYYQLHKEEVNKKDRDKYHQLHPNARYYKPRKPKVHQISMEELLTSDTVYNN